MQINDSKFKDFMRNIGFDKEMDALEHGFCPTCQKPIIMEEFRDRLSKKEFAISGMCQLCQDEVFGE